MKILITGGQGFIGSNIVAHLSKSHRIFAPCKSQIDWLWQDRVRACFEYAVPELIIHCASVGGRNTTRDSADVVYENIAMFEHIMTHKPAICPVITFGSGAAYDRSRDIIDVFETEVDARVPIDYYGFSKNLIAKRCNHIPYTYMLTLFNCFGRNEKSDRFISTAIRHILYGATAPLSVSMRVMDFFYIGHLLEIIDFYIKSFECGRYNDLPYNMNCCYSQHLSLCEIYRKIQQLADKPQTLPKFVLQENSYTGSNTILRNLLPKFCDETIESGLREMLQYYPKEQECTKKEMSD